MSRGDDCFLTLKSMIEMFKTPFRIVTDFYCASSNHAVYAVVACLRLCMSVCLSVTSRCSTKMVKRKITLTTSHDSRDSSFLTPNILVKFEWGHRHP